jgi:hypothetical protein
MHGLPLSSKSSYSGSENQFLVQGLIVTEAEKDSPSSISPVMSGTASLLSKEAHKN